MATKNWLAPSQPVSAPTTQAAPAAPVTPTFNQKSDFYQAYQSGYDKGYNGEQTVNPLYNQKSRFYSANKLGETRGNLQKGEDVAYSVFSSSWNEASDAEKSYMAARNSGHSSDAYLADVQRHYNDSAKAVEDLNRKIADLTKEQLTYYDPIRGVSAVDNSRKIEQLNAQLNRIQAEYDRFQEELGYARGWKNEDDDKAWLNERLGNYSNYSDIYNAATQSVQQLQAERDRLQGIVNNFGFGIETADESGNRIFSGGNKSEERQNAKNQLILIEQALENAERRQNLVRGMLGNDRDAADAVQAGKKLVGDYDTQYKNKMTTSVLGNEDVMQNVLGGYQGGDISSGGLEERQREGSDILRDTSWGRPDERWSQEQKNTFYIIASKFGVEAATDYAANVNAAYNKEEENKALEKSRQQGAGMSVREADSTLGSIARGVGNFGVGVLGVAGQIAASPAHIASWTDKVTKAALRGGHEMGRGSDVWLTDKMNAFVGGRAEQLNKDYGTIQSGFLKGKGAGDLYQLAISSAQSLVLGNVAGEGATLAIFFGQAADSAYDEAIANGASTEQATLFSFLSGCAETIGEKVSLENLLDEKKAATRTFLKNILVQGGIEGSEEGFTELLNLFGDAIAAKVTGGRTEIENQRTQLMRQGLSYDEAEKQIVKDWLKEAAISAIGGFISGGASAGVQNIGQAGSEIRNWLAEHANARADDKVYKEFKASSDSKTGKATGEFAGYDTAKLFQLARGAAANNDTKLREAVIAELVNRRENLLKEEHGKDYSVDRQKIEDAIKAQLDRAANRETKRPGEYNEGTTPPASEVMDQEQAPTPTDDQAPPENPFYDNTVGQQDDVGDMPPASEAYEQRTPPPHTEAEMPTQENTQQQVPYWKRQMQQTQDNAWSREHDIYTIYELKTKNPNGAKTVAQWKASIQEAVQNNPVFVDQILDDSALLGIDKRSAFAKALNQVKAELSTNSAESGTIKASNDALIASAKEANNGREQAVSEPGADTGYGETSKNRESEKRIGGSYGKDGGLVLPDSTGSDKARSGKLVTEIEDSELSDTEETRVPTAEEKSGVLESLSDNAVVISNPGKNTISNHLRQTARDLHLKSLYLVKGVNGSAFSKRISGLFSKKYNVIISAITGNAYNDTGSVIHEGLHQKLFEFFYAHGNYDIDSRHANAKLFSDIFSDLFPGNSEESEYALSKAATYVQQLPTYQNVLDSLRPQFITAAEKYFEAIGDENPSRSAMEFVSEHDRSYALEEFFNFLIEDDSSFMQNFSDNYNIPYSDLLDLREIAIEHYVNAGILTQDEANAIEKRLDEAADFGGTFVDSNVSVKNNGSELNNKQETDSDTLYKVSSAQINPGINRNIRKAVSGDVGSLTKRELLDVLTYALDRATPETKGKPVLERVTDLFLSLSDESNGNSKSWSSERGYSDNTAGSLDRKQTVSLVKAVRNVLNEFESSGMSISKLDSDITDFENDFGIATNEEGEVIDLSQEAKKEQDREDEIGNEPSDLEKEDNWDRNRKPAIMRSLKQGNDIVESFGVTQENGTRRIDVPVGESEKTTWTVNGKEVEVSGWVTPKEVDRKSLKQAEDAVKAKGDEASIKDRIKLLEARRSYLEAVAEQTRKARADFYGSENIEQRKADLGYMADNIKNQLEQLDADIGYLSDELDKSFENNPDPNNPQAVTLSRSLEEAQNQSDRLKTQLEALRDEYRHLESGDTTSLKNVREQIDRITNEILSLSRKIDGVSRRAERADWGSNKRTLFNGKSVSESEKTQKPDMRPGAGNRTEELDSKSGFPKSVVERAKALDDVFKSSFEYKASSDEYSDPLSGETYTAEQGRQNRHTSEQASLRDDLKNIIEGKGMLFEYQTDEESANRDPDSPNKPVSDDVLQSMLRIQESVKGILEDKAPVRHVMNLVNEINSAQRKNSNMGWLATSDIVEIADEIKSTFEDREMDNDLKAKNMADAAVRLLAAVGTRVNRAETHRAMELALELNASKNGIRNAKDLKGLKRGANWMKSMQYNPTTIAKMIDGFDSTGNGDGYKLSRMMSDSVAKEQMLFGNVHSRYAELKGMKGIDDFVEGRSMSPVKLDTGHGEIELTEQQAIDFIKMVRILQIRHVGSQSRLETIKGFGIRNKDGSTTFVNTKDLVKQFNKVSGMKNSGGGDGSNARQMKYDPVGTLTSIANDMEKALSPTAKKYLEITNGILFDLGKQVSTVKQRVTGIGFMDFNKGDYYPIRYINENGNALSGSNDDSEIFDAFHHITKATGGYALVESCADTVDRYIDRAIYAASYGDLADTLSFLNSGDLGTRGLANAMADSFGKDFGRAIENYVATVNKHDGKSKFDSSLLRSARLALQKGALRFSISVPIKQTASYWDAMGVLSPEALRQAYRFKITKAKGYGAENDLLKARAVGGIDPTLSEILNNQGFMSSLKKKSAIVKAMDMATSVMDYRTVDDLFHATIIEAKNAFPDIDPNSKQFQDIVASLFQDVVLQTQPVFNKNARAEYQRSNNEFIRALGMFRTQQTQNLNRMVVALGEYRASKGTSNQSMAARELRRTIAGQVIASAEFGVLSIIADMARHKLKPYRKDDDDDTIDPMKILKRFGLNTLESAAGTLWFGDQVAKWLIDVASGDTSSKAGEFYGLNLGSITSAVSAISSIGEDAGKFVKAVKTGDWSEVNASNLRYDVTNAMQLFGLSANNVINMINSAAMYGLDIVDYASGHTKGNRGVYDDAFKMFNDMLHGTYTQKTAQHQVDKYFRKGDVENLLYNLSILDDDARTRAQKAGGDDPHKGHNYLVSLITGPDSKATAAAEEAEYGRKLSGNERIANYLVDSGLDNDKIDEAMQDYASSGGYNDLYNALREAGMAPKQAVNELYKSDNKNGMQTTDIRSDESVNSLLAGVDKPGDGNDVPALQRKNLDEYIDYATAVKVFIETNNYRELDRMVSNYSKLDKNTQAVLAAKDSNLVHLVECSRLGVSSEAYYGVKQAMKNAQVELDKTSATGSDLKLIALGNAKLSKQQREALINSEWLGISKTGTAVYSALSPYMSTANIGRWLHNADFSYDDSNGTLSNIEVAAALSRISNLTDEQRSQIYNTLRSELSNKYNDWGRYSYANEIAYITRKKLNVGRNAS